MNYNILIGTNDIKLDSTMNVDERIEFCQEVIDEYEPYLTYRLPIDYHDNQCSAYKIESRLERLATYILCAVPVDREYPWQTYYKEQRAKRNELDFTDLAPKNDKYH